MTDAKQQTIATYNDDAEQFAKKFEQLGARGEEVRMVFEKRGIENPHVLELGCGTGRDAAIIVQHTNQYLGIDVSEKLLDIAVERVPGAQFKIEDLETMEFPHNLDIIFAFASLLHSPKEELQNVLKKAHASLKDNGLFYISLKNGEYREELVHDKHGTRTFYYYNPELMKDLSNDHFETIYTYEYELGGKPWFEVMLKKL